MRCGGRFGDGLVDILLGFCADGAGIDDGSFNGAEQIVRERGQCRRGGWLRLHERAPCAQQEPQSGERQPRDALRAERGDATRPAMSASAMRTRLGRSQSQCATTMPAAKSHAAWKSGMAAGVAAGGLVVMGPVCMGGAG